MILVSIWMARALVKFITLDWEWIVALLIITSFKKNIIDIRLAFVVDQKLPNTTCLIVIDLRTCTRKWCNQYLNYANEPWMLFYTESQIFPTRKIGNSLSSNRSIYWGLNDSNKLPLSNYSLTLRFTNYYTFIICLNVRKWHVPSPWSLLLYYI